MYPKKEKEKVYKTFLILALMVTFFQGKADNTDTLYLKNSDVLVGEIKGMSHSVVTFETDYSDSDFKIKWLEIKEIHSDRVFMITMSNGQLVHAAIAGFEPENSTINIETLEMGLKNIKLHDIVDMEPFESSLWSRVSGSIDFGYTYTRANNLQQLSTRSTLGYLGNRWATNVSFDMVQSVQDSTDAIRRTNANVTLEYYLQRNYFLVISSNFLQNDEQKLALRATTRAGAGKFLVRNNKMYLSVATGGAWNNERFTEENQSDRNSAEAFLALSADLFNTGDLSLTTSVVGYPSLTESGRFRSDFKFDLKYDLPFDFYIRLGYTLNYDNQPVAGAPDTDYVLQTTVGWSF